MTAIKDLMLETFEVSKVLIIAPLRVARDTWPAEIEKWDHLQGLDISVIVGDTKTRIAALHHPAMIYVINRENIKWLVEYYEKNGMRWDFGMVVSMSFHRSRTTSPSVLNSCGKSARM